MLCVFLPLKYGIHVIVDMLIEWLQMMFCQGDCCIIIKTIWFATFHCFWYAIGYGVQFCSRGPSTNPCGTPQLTYTVIEEAPWDATYCLLIYEQFPTQSHCLSPLFDKPVQLAPGQPLQVILAPPSTGNYHRTCRSPVRLNTKGI